MVMALSTIFRLVKRVARRLRGRRLYPLTIQSLAAVARARGVRRIYMKTLVSNTASQHGIARAGLARNGTPTVMLVPVVHRVVVLRRFR